MSWQAVQAALDEGIRAGAYPSAAAIVTSDGETLFEAYAGAIGEGAPAGSETRYDLSSLTKPLATLTSLLLLIDRGAIAFEDPVAKHLPWLTELKGAERLVDNGTSIADLLGHRSGLPAHVEFWRGLRPPTPGAEAGELAAGRRAVIERAATTELEYEPQSRSVYSDLGFMLLGAVIESVSELSLSDFAEGEVFGPLGMTGASFMPLTSVPPSAELARIAPCGPCPWRAVGSVRGAVQDENAYAMGGVAGHAGVFGTARDVALAAGEFVAAARDRGRILSGDSVRRANRRWSGETKPDGTPVSTWALGWDTPTPGASSAGSRVAASAYGHLGFTGTSVWIDPIRNVEVVLLTNRLEPDRENTTIRTLRPAFHDAVFAAVDAESARERRADGR